MEPGRLRRRDLGLLERPRETAAAVGAAHARDRVVADAGARLLENRVAGDRAAVERDERQVAPDVLVEVPVAPAFEVERRNRLVRLQVLLDLERRVVDRPIELRLERDQVEPRK